MGGLSSIQFFLDFWNFFNFAKPLSVQYEYRCIQCWAQIIMCECLDYYVFYLEYVKSVCRQILLLLHSLHIGLSQRTVFK